MFNACSRGDHSQLFCAQQRHRRDSNRSDLHHGQPRAHQHGCIGTVQQHAIARHHAHPEHQDVRYPVGLLRKFGIGPAARIAVERDTLAMPFRKRIVQQHAPAVEARGILKFRQIEMKLRPRVAWRQMVARECIDMRRVDAHREITVLPGPRGQPNSLCVRTQDPGREEHALQVCSQIATKYLYPGNSK